MGIYDVPFPHPVLGQVNLVPSRHIVTVHEFMLAGATGEGNQPGQLEDSS